MENLHNLTTAPFVQSFINMAEEACRKGWHESNGGNLSYRIREDELSAILPFLNETHVPKPLGVSVKELAGEYFIMTGAGRYLHNALKAPAKTFGIIRLDERGENYIPLWGFENGHPTSELTSHLLYHARKKVLTMGKNRVVYHCHPTNIIALSFILPAESRVLSEYLWGMMPECVLTFPEGVGVLEWMVPGTAEIATASVAQMEYFNAIVWACHGLFTCGSDFDQALGLAETVEKAAEICVKLFSMGHKTSPVLENAIKLAEAFKLELRRDFP